jgi:hypothetical protein
MRFIRTVRLAGALDRLRGFGRLAEATVKLFQSKDGAIAWLRAIDASGEDVASA